MASVKGLWLVATMLLASMGASGCMGGGCDIKQDAEGQRVLCIGASVEYTLQGSRSSYSEEFTWNNRAARASVEAIFQGMGNIAVTIHDADGKQVYSRQHSGSGQTVGRQATESGTAGEWTIRVQATGLQGQVVMHLRPG